MRVLVTGAAGFVGRHLAHELAGSGHTVVGADTAPRPPWQAAALRSATLEWQAIDLLDAVALDRRLPEWRPDAMVHLAAIASVGQSSADPGRTYRVNVRGTLNLLRAFRKHAPRAKLLIVSTAQVYGNRPRARPIREDASMDPDNAYAESKAWSDYLALLYATGLGMNIITVRPHNHTGPGQGPNYAVPAFAGQVAAALHDPVNTTVSVGNLASRRDISDVRDVVKAYGLLLERGRSGRAYNLATGQLVTMRAVLTAFCRLADIQPRIAVDSARWRPADESPLLDTTAIRRDTGWEPRIPLETTLRDVWQTIIAADRKTTGTD